MKKYISVLAAACAILLSGCANDNAAIYTADDIPGSSVADIAAGTSGGLGSEAGATAPAGGTDIRTPSYTAGHTDSSDKPKTSAEAYKENSAAKPSSGTSDSSASVPPADTTVRTANSTAVTTGAEAVGTSPIKTPEEYAPSYIGGDGSVSNKSVFDVDGIFDEVMEEEQCP